MFAKPAIGEKISVTTDFRDLYKTSMPHVRATRSFGNTIGIVVENMSWVADDCFCMTTGMPHHPIAVIAIERVHNLEYVSGKEAEQIEAPSKEDATWSVKGSGKKFYTVTKKKNIWSCTCPGFTFRKKCKHVDEKKKEVLNG